MALLRRRSTASDDRAPSPEAELRSRQIQATVSNGALGGGVLLAGFGLIPGLIGAAIGASNRRAAFAAAGLSGAYPIAWAMTKNLASWLERGATTFTFAGNLPPGVDEDDLPAVVIIGLLILVGQATAEAWRASLRP